MERDDTRPGLGRVAALGALAACLAVVGGLVSNAAASDERWPGPLNVLREHRWMAVLIFLVFAVALGIASTYQERAGRQKPLGRRAAVALPIVIVLVLVSLSVGALVGITASPSTTSQRGSAPSAATSDPDPPSIRSSTTTLTSTPPITTTTTTKTTVKTQTPRTQTTPAAPKPVVNVVSVIPSRDQIERCLDDYYAGEASGAYVSFDMSYNDLGTPGKVHITSPRVDYALLKRDANCNPVVDTVVRAGTSVTVDGWTGMMWDMEPANPAPTDLQPGPPPMSPKSASDFYDFGGGVVLTMSY